MLRHCEIAWGVACLGSFPCKSSQRGNMGLISIIASLSNDLNFWMRWFLTWYLCIISLVWCVYARTDIYYWLYTYNLNFSVTWFLAYDFFNSYFYWQSRDWGRICSVVTLCSNTWNVFCVLLWHLFPGKGPGFHIDQIL